jgi:spermidine/putrescine-binding protein
MITRGSLIGLGAFCALLAASPVAAQEFKGMTLTVLASSTDVNQLNMKPGNYGYKFEQATGAKLNLITGSAPTNFSKVLAAKGREPSFQLAMLEGPTQAQAVQAGALHDFDYSKVPNIKNLVAHGIPIKGHAPAYNFFRFGSCINTTQYKANNIPLPTSIDDWFNPAIAGHVILPSPGNFWWQTGMQSLADGYGIPLSDPEKLFDKLRAMKPTSLFSSSGEAQSKLQSGEAWLAPTSDGRCYALKMTGQPVDFMPLNLKINGKVYEYALDSDIYEIPAGVTGKQLELAYKFIDMFLEPDALIPTTENFGYLPTTVGGLKLVREMPKLKEVGMIGPNFSFDNLYSPDAEKIVPYVSKWLDAWNKTFVK